MIRLVHLTDPHLTPLDGESLTTLLGKRWTGYLSWRRHRRHIHRPEALARLTEAARAENADQILVTGDLVQIGLASEIEAAAEWLSSLGPPGRVMLVPGNHDTYAADSWDAVARYWQPYLSGSLSGSGATASPGGDAPSQAGFPVRRELSGDGVRVSLFGLSSARPSPVFMADGALGDGQLRRLDRALDSSGGLRCLLLHHPPVAGITSRRKGLRDAAGLGSVLDRHGAHLLLHGHVHRNLDYPGPGGARVFATASASSIGGHGRAAYRCFDVHRDGSHWRVDMRLVTVTEDGPEVVDQASWRALSPASETAAG